MSLFDDILSAPEVAERFRLSQTTVSQVCKKGKRLIHGVDCVNKGGGWLILRESAERLWGWRLLTPDPGYQFCRKCGGHFPESDFREWKSNASKGRRKICMHCEGLYHSGWVQQNKKRLRPQRREQARRYRIAHPDNVKRINKRSRLKRAIEQISP